MNSSSFIVTLALFGFLCLAEGYPYAQTDKVEHGFRDVADDDQDVDETARSKRSADDNLQEFRDTLLHHLNEYRDDQGLPEFEVDHTLEAGAQAWANHEMETLTMSHSCYEDCPDYSEILGKRRSSRPIPEGADAGDYMYTNWFADDEDKTYAPIIDDIYNHKVGFGIAFVQDPSDNTYHAYAVARFARID